MDLGIAGRTALVGGASSGLGRATAERLAAEGCRLALWARSSGPLEAAAELFQSRYGVDVATFTADAADPAAAADVAEAASEALGRVDILVLNAGGPPPVESTGTDPGGWGRSLQLLALTPIDLATRLLPGMREAGWGRIVAILSWGIRQPIPELAYSNSGRSALAAWLKTVAREVAADGVTINGVLPGRFETERIVEVDRARAERQGRTPDDVRRANEAGVPVGRYGRPEELAALVAFLASEPASYMTGTFTAVDGGMLEGMP